jgi:hypothetical protein
MNSGPNGKEEVLAEQEAGTFMARLAVEPFPICPNITELSNDASLRAALVLVLSSAIRSEWYSHESGSLRRPGNAHPDNGDNIPKSMIPIGDKPILWHLMNSYSEHGHKDFVLCIGYKASTIKEFFLSDRPQLYSDCGITQGGTEVELLGKPRRTGASP